MSAQCGWVGQSRRVSAQKPSSASYRIKLGGGPSSGYVYEDEAWSWSRKRAEPYFGQDQAAFAASLLLEQGKTDAAAAALTAALLVDEWSASRAGRLARILRDKNLSFPAWIPPPYEFAVQPLDPRSPTCIAIGTAHRIAGR